MASQASYTAYKLIDAHIVSIQILDSSNRETLEKLKQKPIWKRLKAVQQGNIYPVDMLTWFESNLLAADAVINDLEKYNDKLSRIYISHNPTQY